jgi:mannose/fructose-specific phosphotransferase system component IIA
MSRHLLIATHAGLARGFMEALDILVGNTSNITVINCFTEVPEPRSVIAEYFSGIQEEDELIVMTDLMGGSVNQIFMGYLPERSFHLITGINLPLVLQIALCFEDTVTVDFINETIELAKNEIKYVNHEVALFSASGSDDKDADLF